jgi:hemolysin III
MTQTRPRAGSRGAIVEIVIGNDVRPHLRGVSHRYACWAAIGAGIELVAVALPGRRLACAVYALGLVAMYGVSATLHRGGWSPRALTALRRADHSTIFLCIAATYTPFSLLGLGGDAGMRLLALAWLACGLGAIRALAWPHAPRLITSTSYVAAGWVVLADLDALRAALDPTTYGLALGGGVIYTLGAVTYLFRWPDPWPRTFGYHEVFHVLIIVGSACHFAAVTRLAVS